MSKSSYMPDKQADQVAWAAQFLGAVQANAPQYGVPATMVTAFSAIVGTMQEAWAAASNPATRTKGTVAAKDVAVKNMKTYARGMVSIVQGMPGVTDEMKITAGLTVRKTKPTPRPVPVQRPFVKVINVDGRTVRIELRQDAAKRGRPAGVASATVLTASGITSPMTADGWIFGSTTTRTTVDVPFPPSETGDTVWITAYWSNTRGETGPGATPISINLPAGGQMATKAQSSMKLRAA